MSGSGTRSTGKNPNRIRNGSTRYGLRCKSESSTASTSKDETYLTPMRSEVAHVAITPSTQSSKVYSICKGIDDFRSLKFKDAITEFTEKIDAFKALLTKSFDDNNSTLNHALDTIKHFILHIDADKINDSFSKIDSGVNALCNEVASLPSTA